MSYKDPITRGELNFYLVDARAMRPAGRARSSPRAVACWLGEPGDVESELVFVVNESFIPNVIAGLLAFKVVPQ